MIDALRIPAVLRDEYGKQATRPLMVAKGLEMTPTGGTFRMLTGAATAYGLTDGAAQSDEIALTSLGRRAVAPTAEGDDVAALAEAVLKPRVVREFLQRYDGSRVPSRPIAENVVEELGVPSDSVGRVLDLILVNAEAVGFLQDIAGQQYIDLNGSPAPSTTTEPLENGADTRRELPERKAGSTDIVAPLMPDPSSTVESVLPPAPSSQNDLANNKRVFISHGRNMYIVNQKKEILTFGGFEPVVSVENETLSKPVPDKVMDDMRSCGAAIVHVGSDKKIEDKTGVVHDLLNENVLIEIGGALALYRGNFILLVEKGVTLPSNLQGLYQVRYDGATLDYEATMKLLKAFNHIKASTFKD
ncbi:TIR domain-containing protein [Curtobacterium sp. VKM Ac-1376]|uniref:TIR domain-containing protein n=1 Tax=Curtobacterium sp. VKM Ac-1376 TaxID=123312 RepID=UPI00188D4F0E|nr:TIR domain-containing protein [Curtobacterium sp. VKM Ac-1376]MBF4614711.1 nucleotide-binding protein [Curtobacterium sp. VKM Ac-1376]